MADAARLSLAASAGCFVTAGFGCVLHQFVSDTICSAAHEDTAGLGVDAPDKIIAEPCVEIGSQHQIQIASNLAFVTL